MFRSQLGPRLARDLTSSLAVLGRQQFGKHKCSAWPVEASGQKFFSFPFLLNFLNWDSYVIGDRREVTYIVHAGCFMIRRVLYLL